MNMKACIFNNTIGCGHFINGEYRCIIFKQKCDNLKYRTEYGINQFGDLVSLIFKDIRKEN